MYSEHDLNRAREYAAQLPVECAREAVNNPDFLAKHLTEADKKIYINRELNIADQIIQGKLDCKFTVWQRMNLYLTGEMVPFFNNVDL